jgi:hypothetical protein
MLHIDIAYSRKKNFELKLREPSEVSIGDDEDDDKVKKKLLQLALLVICGLGFLGYGLSRSLCIRKLLN